jgi:hypothetical protein
MIPINDEKTDTAHSPARMRGADRFVKGITSGFATKEECVVLKAIENMTTKYTTKVVSMAHRVPFGIILLGSLRSPDMDAPAKMPEVAL